MTATSIPLSKVKFARNLIICFVFIVLSLWLITMKPDPDRLLFPEAIRYAAGWIGLVIFGAFAVIYIGMIIRRKPGLTISTEGITDYSSAISVGFIPWKDISFFVTVRRVGQVFIVPKLHDPEAYIRRGNFWARYLMRSNFRQNGSPVAITPVILKASATELMALLEEGLAASKQNI